MNDELVLTAIDRLYQAVLEPALWPEALDGVAGLSGGAGLVIIPEPSSSATPAFTYTSAALQDQVDAYRADWFAHCPRRLAIRRRGLRDAVFDEADLFTPWDVERSPYYQEHLRSFDCGLMLARATTGLRPGAVHYIASQRRLGAGQARPDERRAFGLLTGHLIGALQVYRRLASAAAAHRPLADLLDGLGCGAVVVDSGAHVLHANGAAERLAGDGFSLLQGRLAASANAEQGRILGLIRRALQPGLGEGGGQPESLSRPSGGRPLLLQAIPVSAALDGPLGALLDDVRTVLMLIVDPAAEAAPRSVDALRLLGLTATEARVAAALGAGASPGEIAEAAGVSLGTVRGHVRSIHAKLDIRRQGELTRIVQALAPLAAAYA